MKIIAIVISILMMIGSVSLAYTTDVANGTVIEFNDNFWSWMLVICTISIFVLIFMRVRSALIKVNENYDELAPTTINNSAMDKAEKPSVISSLSSVHSHICTDGKVRQYNKLFCSTCKPDSIPITKEKPTYKV